MTRRRLLLSIGIFVLIGAAGLGAYLFFKEPYTAKGVKKLYTLDSLCDQFSSDSKLVITTHGIYNLASGELQVDTYLAGDSSTIYTFSPDNQLVAQQYPDYDDPSQYYTGGLWETSTGTRLTDFPPGILSPNGSLLVSPYDAIYDVETGEKLLEIDGFGSFTEVGNVLILENMGAYDAVTLEKLVAESAISPTIRAIDSHLAETEPVYTIESAELLFPAGTSYKLFSEEGIAYASGNGFYSLQSGELLLEGDFSSLHIEISPDAKFVAVDQDGIYSLENTEKILSFGANTDYVRFSEDSNYLVAAGEGIYATDDWAKLQPLDETTRFFEPSPNSESWFLLDLDGAAYSFLTGQKLFEAELIASTGLGVINNGQWMAVPGDAVYDLGTYEPIINNVPAELRVNPDMTDIVAVGKGVYSFSNGEQRFELREPFERDEIPIRPKWSEDNSLFWVEGDGVYDYESGELLISTFVATDVKFQPEGLMIAVNRRDPSSCTVYRDDRS